MSGSDPRWGNCGGDGGGAPQPRGQSGHGVAYTRLAYAGLLTAAFAAFKMKIPSYKSIV